ncbi:MAG: TetR/AcrR family transcriptional regulator [Acholeplasmataceae bacterium]|nr:TetR/AcrR family transcriptional regulator [Acholeplasmataceae bacterium]
MKTFIYFENLKEEKRKKIINAGLEVFSSYGYEHASTDIITQKAQISKGALFHYFEDKENFFIYLFNYATKEFTRNVNPDPPLEMMDIFDYLPYITMQKIELLKGYPYLVGFVMNAYEKNYALLKDRGLIDSFDDYQKHSQYIYEKLNFSNLKDGISKEELLSWTAMISQGFIHMYSQFPQEQHEQLVADLLNFFVELKRNFRKE